MDINQILLQALMPMIAAYWWLAPMVILIAFLKTPFMKGVIGEFQVNLAAKLFLDKQVYKLFKNVTLPTDDGTTQIDHVIVSRYGIFVIETKNMKGWIFGSAQQKNWSQKIYRHSTQFQNPLHQNYKHTQTLQAALVIAPEKLFSLVVFIGDSSFKTPVPENVVYAGGYIRFIKSKKQVLLTDAEVSEVSTKIQTGRLKPTLKTHQAHVKHVKSIVEQKQQPKPDNVCPKCGKPMVLRKMRNNNNQANEFWGCSAFPSCRTIRPIV